MRKSPLYTPWWKMLWLRLVADKVRITLEHREYLYYIYHGTCYIVKEPTYPIE